MCDLSGSLKRHNEIQDLLGLNVDEIEIITGLPKEALAKMWDKCIPKFKKNDKYIGQIIIFGTGDKL